MSMTVYDQAAYSYGTYNLINSETYQNNAVDTSEVSKKCYNISSVSNAIDAMNQAASASAYSIGRVDSFVKTQFDTSQLGNYQDINKVMNSDNVSDPLTNSTDLSNVNNAVSSYSSYLEEEMKDKNLLDVAV